MPSHRVRRGFASNQIKIALASLLAAAGVLLAVRALLPTRSERTDEKKPQIVTAEGYTPVPRRQNRPAPKPADFGWTEARGDATYEFQRVSNAADARNLADAIGRAVDTSGDASDGLGGDLVGLLAPALAGEGSAREAIVALGGEDTGTIDVLDTIMQTVLKHASADPSAIAVSTPDEQPQALGALSVNRNRTTDVDADGNEVERDVISLVSSFERAFPGALADDATGPLRTVEIPMRSQDATGNAADTRLEMTLRYSSTAQAWQPAAMTIDSTDPGLMQRVMAAIRSIRDSQTSAEPNEGGS